MNEDKTQTIEQLREILAKQILELAIDSDNPQYKVDAYKATATSGRVARAEAAPAAAGGMSMFQARIRAAEAGKNGAEQPTETDC